MANESGKHIAITGIKDDKSVNWLEKLSNDEYEKFIKKANL
ncbi:hypothetical protein [Campylobacter mucosalis]|nr:hypothetical protein [Campylobacter mucosalis]